MCCEISQNYCKARTKVQRIAKGHLIYLHVMIMSLVILAPAVIEKKIVFRIESYSFAIAYYSINLS